MKQKIYNSILFVTVMAVITIFASSCSKDDSSSDNGGAPYISYIRVANPASADSLLVAAYQGQLIAIVGGNLQNTKQIWFNDLQSLLTPTYMTSTCILASVPNEVPSNITDNLKLVFANGDSLLYPFTVTISKPLIDGGSSLNSMGMDCEYVADGEIATIHGQYFYFPLTVTFEGGVSVSSDDGDVTVNDGNTILSVKVPEGAQPGQIIVTSNFGTSKSNFWFRDNRNIFQGFENDANNSPDPSKPFGELGSNATLPDCIITSPAEGDPPLINGNYFRAIWNTQTWWWQLFCNWNNGLPIPDDAILHPSDYFYKFEVCTMKPYNASGIHLWITNMAEQNNTPFYQWAPALYDTKGAWQTVVIPLEDIVAAENSDGIKHFPGAPLPDGYFCGVVYAGSDALDCDMSFDNFRIVPKVSQ